MSKLAIKVVQPDSREGLCQHPQTRKQGLCGREAVGEFDIPKEYNPPIRHVLTPNIPKPKARLCQQHWAKMNAIMSGDDEFSAGSHEAQCKVCILPPAKVKAVEDMWINWVMTTTSAAAELGVSVINWNRHVNYFGLAERKQNKVHVRRALVLAAEKGLDGKGHNAMTGLKALEMLQKNQDGGDNINVRMVNDLTDRTDEDLINMLGQMMKQLKPGADDRGQVIEIPASSVKVHK